MQKIIIDTNVLVSSIIQLGYPNLIVDSLFIEKKIELCISELVLEGNPPIKYVLPTASTPHFFVAKTIGHGNTIRKAIRIIYSNRSMAGEWPESAFVL